MKTQGLEIKKICQKCGQAHFLVPGDARPFLSMDQTTIEGWMWECTAIDATDGIECGSTLFLKNSK